MDGHQLAEELTAHDAFAAHVDAELGIDPNAVTNPRHAHIFPAIAFTVGSIQSCPSGGARWAAAVARIVTGAALATAVTYGIGQPVELPASE